MCLFVYVNRDEGIETFLLKYEWAELSEAYSYFYRNVLKLTNLFRRYFVGSFLQMGGALLHFYSF